jgi:hypothetical protein
MSLSPDLLVAEADQLVARAERNVKRHVSGRDEHVQRARRELQRLWFYRAVLLNKPDTSALMLEYIFARGLAGR